MSRSAVLLSISLGVIILSLGAYAWHLHQRLATAETALAARAKKDFQSAPQPVAPSVSRSAGGLAPANGATPTPSNRRGSDSNSAYATPAGRRLVLLQYKGGLDRPYAALFKQLNLGPTDLAKLKSLLAERTMAEVFPDALAGAAGLNPDDDREQIQKLANERATEIDAAVRVLLGETGYQRYQHYDQTQSQRSCVNQLEQRLSYSSAPLYGNQPEQLVSLLAVASPDQNAPDIESIATQSAGFLSQPQIEELRQLLQDQAAMAELRRQIQQQQRMAAGGTPVAFPTAGTGR